MLRDFNEIIEIIKDIISNDIGNRKVFDRDVADILNMSAMNIATCKKRSTIPFEKIIEFANKKQLDLNYLLTQGVVNV